MATIGQSLPPDVADGLTPHEAKGLEYDTVVLVEPAAILREDHGLSLLYVAVTRATHRLVIVHAEPLPEVINRALTTGRPS